MNYKFKSYKDKPDGIYKTSDTEYNCACCAYINKQYCELRKVKLDIFLLTKRRCRDFLGENRSIPFNIDETT